MVRRCSKNGRVRISALSHWKHFKAPMLNINQWGYFRDTELLSSNTQGPTEKRKESLKATGVEPETVPCGGVLSSSNLKSSKVLERKKKKSNDRREIFDKINLLIQQHCYEVNVIYSLMLEMVFRVINTPIIKEAFRKDEILGFERKTSLKTTTDTKFILLELWCNSFSR